MDLNETTLRNWYLITFHDAPEPNRILWGTVADDPSFRWAEGDWCCTSAILDQTGNQVYVTKNTRYTLQGPGATVELPLKSLISLRQGISPAEYAPSGLMQSIHATIADLDEAGLLDDTTRRTLLDE